MSFENTSMVGDSVVPKAALAAAPKALKSICGRRPHGRRQLSRRKHVHLSEQA